MQGLIVAALSLVGVLIGAALQFAFGQRLEARKQFGVQRAQAYIDFFRAVSALAQDRSKEQLALAADAKTRICIYGSMTLVQRLSDFERAGAIAAQGAGRAALLELVRAMREDVTHSAIQLRREDLMHILFSRDTTGQ